MDGARREATGCAWSIIQPASIGRLLRASDGADYPDNGFRFSLLARTALEAMRAENRPVDVIHGHDWEGAPAMLLLRHRYADDPVVGARGDGYDVPQPRLSRLGAARQVAGAARPARVVGTADGVDLLREGILAADMVNTVARSSRASR